MNRRVPAQNLRGSDATLLEVQLQNLLRRPMGQLALINAMDLLALSELESPPRSVVTELARFVERCSTEVAELPPSGMNELLDELGSVEATRVPETFRAWLLRESGRDIRDQSRIREILDGYEGVDPEPFVIGERSAKVEHGAAAGRRGAASSERSSARSRTAGSTTRRASSSSGAGRAVRSAIDPAKRKLIERICMERLNGASSDKGLSEVVLVAGVRHRAKNEGFDAITPAEVTAALRALKDANRVRHSAGRWMSTSRRW